MAYITKTKYVDYMECINRAWLDNYKKAEKKDDTSNNQIKEGEKIGEFARSIFGEYTLIKPSDDYSFGELIDHTKKSLAAGDSVICEATFEYNNNLCMVDILKNNQDGTYSIYEVKGITSPYKYNKLEKQYLDDISFQYYVLKKCGINVKSTYIIYINNQYEYDGNAHNLNSLFQIDNVDEYVFSEYSNVENNLKQIDKTRRRLVEPEIIFASKCKECPFNEHCYKTKNIPEKNSVLNLYNDRNKYKYLNKGIKSFKDLLKNYVNLTQFNRNMVECRIYNLEPRINYPDLDNFLSQFEYPIYFFDFETYQEAIPTILHQKPYQQIPFQYSLHVLYEDGTLEHKEYLASNYKEPRLDLIIQMIEDLGKEGTIVAYNIRFEKTRISEMAIDFPEYQTDLIPLNSRFIDLEIPFKDSMYYCKEMSRTSIKDVLPSLFPNEPALDYHILEDVHKGDEASAAYLSLKDLNEEKEEQLRKALLEYCKLDTFAMVKIYQFLKEIIKKEENKNGKNK